MRRAGLVTGILLAGLAALGAAPPHERGRPPALPLRFDFGSGRRVAYRHVISEAQARSESHAWGRGMVRNQVREGSPDLALMDFVEGFDADFAVGIDVPDSRCQVTLTFGDAVTPRGPVAVLDGDRELARSRATAAGAWDSVTVEMAAVGPRLTIRIRSTDCTPFALCRLRIDGPAGARLGKIYRPLPAIEIVPEPDSLPAGGALLGEPRYTQAAFECLDRFADEQLPDGNWYATYFGPARCPTEVHPDTMSTNLADIGTMALALAAGAEADPSRRDRYREALVRYVDAVVLPAQLPDGSLSNGRWRGRDYPLPYTVATATQAATLYALAGLTGDGRYASAADRAAAWLASTVMEDGRVAWRRHDRSRVEPIAAMAIGDLFYPAEALAWAARRSAADSVAAAARQALDRYLWGAAGLAAGTRHDCWWPEIPGGPWGASKAGGIMYVLAEAQAAAPSPRLGRWLDNGLRWIADADRAARFGIAADPMRPGGQFALVATGFAGLGVAAALDPDLVLPPR